MSNPTWTKGMKSPNPGGRPKQYGKLRRKCRALTNEMLETLRNVARQWGENPTAAVSAAKVVLAYGYGAPMAIDDSDTKPLASPLSPDELRAIARGALRAANQTPTPEGDDDEGDTPTH